MPLSLSFFLPELRWVSLSFCIIATLLTIHQIRQHLHWNTAPRLRRYIIRIVSMVPIYAWASWLGLTYPKAALYFDFLRECYEAFVIYCFFQLLVQALGGEERLAYRLAGKEKVQQHQVPFCCLPQWEYADWDCMTQEESERVRQIIKDSEEHRASLEKAKQAQQEEEEKQVDETGTHDEPPVSLERDSSNEREVVLQHPPNAKPQLPISSSSRALVDSKASSRSASRGHSRQSTSTFFGTTFGGNTSQPSTPKQPAVYMAHSLAHSTVSNPFTPSMSNSSHNFSSVTSSPTSAGTASPVKLPYLYSPFLYYTQIGTLQYCVIKPILALISFILGLVGSYGNGEFSITSGYPYIAFVTNASQVWAMYCLILFYFALRDDLQPIRPVPKFLVVKAVVFFTWWQSVLFAVLESQDVITGHDGYDARTSETQLQDFVVTAEMVAAAVAHHFFFSYKDFYDATAPLIIAPMFRSMFEVVNVSDVFVQDVNKIRQKHEQRKKARKQHKDSRRGSQGGSGGLGEGLLGEEGGGEGGHGGESEAESEDEREARHDGNVSIVMEEDEDDEKHNQPAMPPPVQLA